MQRTRRANSRKYHYIYETICLKSHRFYIGMHSTDNLQDSYQGSGKQLWHSFRKHGKDKHVTKILEFLPDRQSLKVREKELVDEELVGNKMCMNLALGGEGGLTFKRTAKHNRLSVLGGKLGNSKQAWLRANNPEWAKKYSLSRSKVSKKLYEDGITKLTFKNKKHTTATKEKMSQHRKGKNTGTKNSQYNTCWIYHLELKQNKKIKKQELDNYLSQGWLKGRKVKF